MAERGESFFLPRSLGPRLDHLASMKNFVIPHKDGDPESLKAWRISTFVLNASRRFRYTANLEKRREAAEMLEVRNHLCPPIVTFSSVMVKPLSDSAVSFDFMPFFIWRFRVFENFLNFCW